MNPLIAKIRNSKKFNTQFLELNGKGFSLLLEGTQEENKIRKDLVDEIINYYQYCKLNNNIVEAKNREDTGKYIYYDVYSNNEKKVVRYEPSAMEYTCTCTYETFNINKQTKSCKHISKCVKIEEYYQMFRLGENK